MNFVANRFRSVVAIKWLFLFCLFFPIHFQSKMNELESLRQEAETLKNAIRVSEIPGIFSAYFNVPLLKRWRSVNAFVLRSNVLLGSIIIQISCKLFDDACFELKKNKKPATALLLRMHYQCELSTHDVTLIIPLPIIYLLHLLDVYLPSIPANGMHFPNVHNVRILILRR